MLNYLKHVKLSFNEINSASSLYTFVKNQSVQYATWAIENGTNAKYGEDLKNQDNVNEKNRQLMKLIERMCKETNEDEKIKAITLYQAINKLSKHLKSIYEKIYDPSIKSIPGKLFDFNQGMRLMKSVT